MELKLQFTPTKEDYVNSRGAIGYSTWVVSAFILGFIIMQIYFGKIALDQPDLATRPDWYLPFLLPLTSPLIAIVFFYISPALNRMTFGSNFKEKPELLSPVAYEMDESQVIIRATGMESKFDWYVFSMAIDYCSYYLLIYRLNNQAYNFIPKRAFEDTKQEEVFRDLVGRKTDGLKDMYYQKKVLPGRIQLMGVIVMVVIMLGYWLVLYQKVF